MQYDFIKQLIDKVKVYEKTVSNDKSIDIKDFAQWILTDASTASKGIEAPVETVPNVVNTDATSSPSTESREGGTRNGGVGRLIGLMYRYAKNYTKKALEKTPLQTLEEFTYLATLLQSPMTKTQLITQHIQEKTTGMAVIQRLIKQNWVKQSENAADGRSQIVEITDEGCKILRVPFLEMSKVTAIVTANLTDAEKAELLRILEKLDLLHRNILETEKTLDLDKIIERYVLDHRLD